VAERSKSPSHGPLPLARQDILELEPPPVSAFDDEITAWRTGARERAGMLIGEIRRDEEPHRKQLARQLADLNDRERIWGRDLSINVERSSKHPLASV
jgi:hypothetical protein